MKIALTSQTRLYQEARQEQKVSIQGEHLESRKPSRVDRFAGGVLVTGLGAAVGAGSGYLSSRWMGGGNSILGSALTYGVGGAVIGGAAGAVASASVKTEDLSQLIWAGAGTGATVGAIAGFGLGAVAGVLAQSLGGGLSKELSMAIGGGVVGGAMALTSYVKGGAS